MNCKTALSMLDACRPHGDDMTDPDLAAAAAHVEDCPECLGQLHARQSLDVRLASVMQAEPVPEALRERIHARLDRTGTRRGIRRRMIWSGAAAAAAALLVGLSVAFWPAPPAEPVQLTANSLAEMSIVDEKRFNALVDLNAPASDPQTISRQCFEKLKKLRLNAVPPAAWSRSGPHAVGRVTIMGHEVAVFRYQDRRGESDVLAFPRSEFTITDLRRGTQLAWQTRDLVVIAWSDQDMTYVAVLKNWAPQDWRPLLRTPGGLT